MEFQWQYAKPLFEKLDVPDYGSKDDWMRWYEEAWTHLTNAKLTHVKTPLDNLVVRLRIFAIGWLAHDFIGAVQSDEWSSCPYWKEWIEFFDIDPLWALITIGDQEIVNALIAESGLSSSDLLQEEEGEGIFCDVDDINEAFFHRMVMVAVYMQRDNVIGALMSGFGGDSGLFMSMYANCHSIEDEIERRMSDLEDAASQVEWQLAQATSDELKQKLQAELDAVRQEIEDGINPQDVIEDFRFHAVADNIYFGDEDSQQRLNGYQWCNEGCPVVIHGEPWFDTP